MSGTVRITLELDQDWISQFATLDNHGQLTFNTDTCSIVAVEQQR